MESTEHYYYSYRLALTYFTFRIILSLALAGISLADQQFLLGGQFQSFDFMLTVAGYFVLALATQLHTLLRSSSPRKPTLFFAIVTDVLFCLVFMHLSGGFATGIGILLLSPVAIAGIFFHGSIALSVAALATIGMLAHVAYMAYLIPEQDKYYVPAGLLGMLFFAASIITQWIARYIRRTEQLAGFNIDLAEKLEKINDRIVEKMQTGVIVVDAQHRVQIVNDSACQLLGVQLTAGQPLSGPLRSVLERWQQQPQQATDPFRQAAGLPSIRASFSVIPGSDVTIVFLENQSQMTQQAQHMKLASLGRLSASIAHEIRNPLSAISHASQLLAESPDIAASDARLLTMIGNHVVRLNNIVDNVLGISRRTPINPTQVDVERCINTIVAHLADSQQQDTHCDIDLTPRPFQVAFDESQLQQVLSNLIDNAIRHSARQTQQRWVGIRGRLEHGIPVLSVYDKGDGIRDADVEKVFEPFYTTHAQGTGLGLYIARELCEMNQALLDYVRDEDGTPCFQIRFAHSERRLNPN